MDLEKAMVQNTVYLLMLEEWKKVLDNKEAPGALLTDFSKDFDWLNRELLITKLHASSYLFHL